MSDYTIVKTRSVVQRGKPAKNLLLCKEGDVFFIREVDVKTGKGKNRYDTEENIKKEWNSYHG